MKRLCLFAGYNSDGEVKQYVLDYLTELSHYCDIYYLADGNLSKESINKIKNICLDAWVVKHGKYDFGSYSELMKNYVGWDEIEKYDELIIANDSCYCVNKFESVFATMSKRDSDAWGLLATDEFNLDYEYSFEEYIKIPHTKVPMFCIGSYFMAFKKNLFSKPEFQDFFNNVAVEKDRFDVCIKYEMGLTRLILNHGFKVDSYLKTVYKNVSIYGLNAFKFIYQGFPLIKTRIFKDNPMSIPYVNDKFFIDKHEPTGKLLNYIDEENYDLKVKRTKINKSSLLPPIIRRGKKAFVKDLLPPILTEKIVKKILERRLDKSKKIKKLNYKTADDLVVFFNVAIDTIGGGMLSIDRFVEQSLKHEENFGFKVKMSGLPLCNDTVTYSKFDTTLPMEHFNSIISQGIPKKVILNIPEVFVLGFLNQLSKLHIQWLHLIPELKINILNQNHDLFPERREVERLKELTQNVTVTAAHERYATKQVSDEFNVPVSLLTPFLPKFIRRPHGEKEKIIAISPDDEVISSTGLTKDKILEKMISALPDYEFVVINDISLNEYKELISKALFTITFGEGYDGYFIEPALSDSVSFAVYNETFFPNDFKNNNSVYESWEKLYDNIVGDIRALEVDSARYNTYSNETEEMVRKYTNSNLSEENLFDFYSNKVDHTPSSFTFEQYEEKNKNEK